MKTFVKNGITIINTGDPVGGCKNKTGFTGIYFRQEHCTYQARIHYNKKKYSLGEFKSIEDAIDIYNEAKSHSADGTFLDWHETLYGKTKRRKGSANL